VVLSNKLQANRFYEVGRLRPLSNGNPLNRYSVIESFFYGFEPRIIYDTLSCKSVSTQRLAFGDATPRKPADTVRLKIEIASIIDRFVLDTSFNGSRYY